MRQANTTFDVWQNSAISVQGGSGHLEGQWVQGNEATEDDRTFHWTHIIEVTLNTDIRDNWPGAPTGNDYLVIPDNNGMPPDETHDKYIIIEAERLRIPGDNFKRVFLQRAGKIMAINLREEDLTPSLTSITTVTLDQDQGFLLTQPAVGEGRITIRSADGASGFVGVVDATEQNFSGNKTFNDHVSISGGVFITSTGGGDYGTNETGLAFSLSLGAPTSGIFGSTSGGLTLHGGEAWNPPSGTTNVYLNISDSVDAQFDFHVSGTLGTGWPVARLISNTNGTRSGATDNNSGGLKVTQVTGGFVTSVTDSEWLENIVEDPTPELGGPLDCGDNDIVDVGNIEDVDAIIGLGQIDEMGDIIFINGGTINTNTTINNTVNFNVYNTDNSTYTTVFQMIAGLVPIIAITVDNVEFRDSTDPTKVVIFDNSEISTGTTITITWPSGDIELPTPSDDEIPFWDDSEGKITWLTLGTNLSITGTTINATGGGSGDLLSTNNLSDVQSAATSRINLGLEIGADVQAWDQDLDDIAALTRSKGDLLAGGGSAWGRLGVGNNGEILVADSSNSLGMKWAILDTTSFPRGYIDGLILSNSTGDSDHDITIAAGACRNSANTFNIELSSITKRLDASHSVGTNAGGLFSGSIAADTWYHVFAMRRDSDGQADAGFDTSATGANAPSGWTVRRIGAVLTNSSSNIIGFTQIGDMFLWDDPPLDFNSSIGTTATAVTLSVPTSVNVFPLIMSRMTSGAVGYVRSSQVNDEAPSTSVAPLWNSLNQSSGSIFEAYCNDALVTDTSGRIYIRNTSSASTGVVTYGWRDQRGRDAA